MAGLRGELGAGPRRVRVLAAALFQAVQQHLVWAAQDAALVRMAAGVGADGLYPLITSGTAAIS